MLAYILKTLKKFKENTDDIMPLFGFLSAFSKVFHRENKIFVKIFHLARFQILKELLFC